MIVNEYGQVCFDTSETIEHMYAGNDFSNFVDSQDEINKHNSFAKYFEIDTIQSSDKPKVNAIEFHQQLSNTWNMPVQYQQLDIESYLAQKLESYNLVNESYIETLSAELDEFKQRNMIRLLQFLVYLTDVCNEHNIITGVGRGSSVASLVLYLIGVHHIDPIKYNLNYREFLR